MSNCSFADQSPSLRGKNFTPGRTIDGKTYRIDTITPHQAWGEISNQNLVNYLNSTGNASCNYCIDKNGNIALVVDEANRSWCSSSRMNDVRAITIENATSRTYPNKASDACMDSLLRLCIDVCKRNGIHKMIWIADKDKALAKQKVLAEGEGIFTIHEWFYGKDCPGTYIKSKMQWLCDETNKALETIKVGDIVLMEVTEIKDGYAYGKVKIDEPLPPVPKGIEVGSKVTINPGAKAGGLNDKYRGKAIDPKYANGKYIDTVNKIEAHYGIEEARLQNIVTWVAVKDLTLVE